MPYPIAKLFFPVLHMLFVKEIRGLENIPKKGPFILAANHQSHLDGLLLASYIIQQTNQHIHFLAKREFTGYFGKTIENIVYKQWGRCLLVEKANVKHKGKHAIEQAINILNNQGIVGIFPEGQRTYNGSLLKGHTGIVRIAEHTRHSVPIIPIGIKNANIMLACHAIIPRIWKTRTTIHIGKLFYITRNKKQRKHEINTVNTVMKKIEALL